MYKSAPPNGEETNRNGEGERERERPEESRVPRAQHSSGHTWNRTPGSQNRDGHRRTRYLKKHTRHPTALRFYCQPSLTSLVSSFIPLRRDRE